MQEVSLHLFSTIFITCSGQVHSLLNTCTQHWWYILLICACLDVLFQK